MSQPLPPDEDLLRRLPLPLARLYRRAHNAKTPLERHLTAFYLWEAALKLLGCVAVVVRQEIVLLIMGGVFVMETASVILQVASYKLTGKRIFRMAPIHHHFELKGWPEPRVIVRFWIISVVLVLIGLATLKVR